MIAIGLRKVLYFFQDLANIMLCYPKKWFKYIERKRLIEI